jgi:hypothetical protein
METSTTTVPEYTKKFKELTPGERECCLAAHAEPFGLSWRSRQHMDTLKRLFKLGNPNITFASDGSYCRIADPESVNVMKVIIREYL